MSPFLKIAPCCFPPGHKAFKIKAFLKNQSCYSRHLPSLTPRVIFTGRCWCPRPHWKVGASGPGPLTPHTWRARWPRGQWASWRSRLFLYPLLQASTASPSPALRARALIATFSCTTERKEEKTPTYVVPTQDSDMLTSLLYPVSNLNTERGLCKSGSWTITISSGAGSLPLPMVPSACPPVVIPTRPTVLTLPPVPTPNPSFYHREFLKLQP